MDKSVLYAIALTAAIMTGWVVFILLDTIKHYLDHKVKPKK